MEVETTWSVSGIGEMIQVSRQEIYQTERR